MTYSVVASPEEMGYTCRDSGIKDNIDLTLNGARLQGNGLECTAVTVRGEEDNPISLDPAFVRGVENNVFDNAAAAGAVRLVEPYHRHWGILRSGTEEIKWGVDICVRSLSMLRQLVLHWSRSIVLKRTY